MFKRFLNSLAWLAPQNHIFSTLLKKKPSWVSQFCSCFLEKMLLVQHPLGHLLLASTVWSENSSEQRPHVCLCGMCKKVFTLSEHLRPIVKLIIYLERGCLLFRGLYNISRWQNPYCSKGSSLTYWALPSPTYPRVSKPCTNSICTFKLRGWVILQVNSSSTGNHRPTQTNQSPKRDNSLSKGQNVDAGTKGRKQDK